MATAQHLVFYDGTCGMCHSAVLFLLKHDHRHVFMFAPLQGQTAKVFLKDGGDSPPNADSLILVENYQNPNQMQISLFGKGALRICWLLGGWWKFPGSLSFLPAVLYDWLYRWIACRRFQWFSRQTCMIPEKQDANRFLP